MRIEYTGVVRGNDEDVQRALEAARRSLWLSNYSEHEAAAAYEEFMGNDDLELLPGTAAWAWNEADYAARMAYTEGWEDSSWDGIRLEL